MPYHQHPTRRAGAWLSCATTRRAGAWLSCATTRRACAWLSCATTRRACAWLSCATVGATSALACSGPAVVAPAPPGPGDKYAAQCQEASAKRAADVTGKKYIPVELVLHQWPGRELAENRRSYVREEELADALTATVAPGQPRVRTALILARGGTGKSALADSLTGQACGRLPFFRLDLNLDVMPKLEGGPAGVNPIAVVIAEHIGEKDPAKAEAAIKMALGDKQWAVVLDSLDETPLLSRDALAKHIDDLVTRVGPNARTLVMTRPPVFSSNYGIATVDAKLEIPNLTCEGSDQALARNVPDPAERQVVDAFIARFGLDRKVVSFERCHYPHLATYRDLQVVRQLAKNAASDKDKQDFKNFQTSRAQVYNYFVTAQLLKDLQGVAMTPQEALGTVDAMVDGKKPDKGERNLAMRIEDCVAASTIADIGAKQSACERLLQSALFKNGASHGEVHFSNQSLGDLFLARWTARQLRTRESKIDCKLLEGKAFLLESNEVAGFLVGQPEGQTCLIAVAQSMCKRSGYAQHIYEQFDQGLPSGQARATLVAGAMEDLKVVPKPDLCVSGLLEGLAKTVDALMPAAIEAAKEPTQAPKKDDKKKAKKTK